MDQIISRLSLEGGGGCSGEESYELGAFFFAERVLLKGAEMPFFFITGDEQMYEYNELDDLNNLFKAEVTKDIVPTKEVFDKLLKQYNVFFLHKENFVNDTPVMKQWTEMVGAHRILTLVDPKSCVDIMLGAIAITSGKRSLESYLEDMKARGQDLTRI